MKFIVKYYCLSLVIVDVFSVNVCIFVGNCDFSYLQLYISHNFDLQVFLVFDFFLNCNFLSHNVTLSRKCDFISHNSDFFLIATF